MILTKNFSMYILGNLWQFFLEQNFISIDMLITIYVYMHVGAALFFYGDKEFKLFVTLSIINQRLSHGWLPAWYRLLELQDTFEGVGIRKYIPLKKKSITIQENWWDITEACALFIHIALSVVP